MLTIWDIIRRTFYLSVFIIPIPIGAYIIHNGSSAVAALFSYVLLSLVMPFLYLRSPKSGFGPSKRRIRATLYWISWFLVQIITFLIFKGFDLVFLWKLPTIGRDISFIIIMYLQVLFSLFGGYLFSRLVSRGR